MKHRKKKRGEKSSPIKEFLPRINKMKLFTIKQLYDLFDVKDAKQRRVIRDSLKKLVQKGYVQRKSETVYMPIFRRDKIKYGVIGYETPKKDFYVICNRYELEPGFSESLVREAERIAFIPEDEIKNRKNYKDQILFTIDGADAKDLDDAVALEKEGNNYKLYVHIADVSFYVKEKSFLDKEAYQRGTSIYLVDRVVPMLPKVISNGICSLNADEDKLSLTAEVLLSDKGEIISYDFFPGIIRSKRRFTYKEVQDIIDNQKVENKSDKVFLPVLKEMQELTQILREKRFKEGAIDFDLPENKIICDKKSRPIEIQPQERLFSHQMVEEFMLTANKCAAMFLEEKKVGMFRVHEEPDESRLEYFVKIANLLGYKIRDFKDSAQIRDFLKSLDGRPESYLLNTLLLRSMQQAYYHHENIGHYGLSFSHYTHFTSPIRRYPDLVVHRVIKKLKGIDETIKTAVNKAFLSDASIHSSKQERVAVEMERAAQKRKAIHFLKEKLGELRTGVVSGVTSAGFYVALDGLGIEGMVVRNLLEDFDFDEEFKEYVNNKIRIGLGTRVKVEIISLNLKRELIDFQLKEVFSYTQE